MKLHPRVQALQDEIPNDLKPFVPIESLIDRATGELIGTMMQHGSWTNEEKADFEALCDDRIERMTPPSLGRLEKLLEPKPPCLPAPRPSFWRRIFG
jgi:hypothetical protein